MLTLLQEGSAFLRQCILELLGRDRNSSARNSDLRQHSFAAAPGPATRSRKRSIRSIKSSFQRNKVLRQQTYSPRQQDGRTPNTIVRAFIFVLSMLVFVAFGGPGYVGSIFSGISLFKIKEISIVGCEPASSKRLQLLSGVEKFRTSMLGLDLADVAARVEADPWVSRARVNRDWPSTLVIDVREHRPVAMMNVTTGEKLPKLFYVDRKGRPFLEVLPGYDVDFPVITGLDAYLDKVGRKRIFQDIHTFLKLVGRNNPVLPAQSVSEVHVNAEGKIVVYLVDYTFPIFFGNGDVKSTYRRLIKVLDALYKEKKDGMLISEVEYIRMDYLDDKVLVAQSESG